MPAQRASASSSGLAFGLRLGLCLQERVVGFLKARRRGVWDCASAYIPFPPPKQMDEHQHHHEQHTEKFPVQRFRRLHSAGLLFVFGHRWSCVGGGDVVVWGEGASRRKSVRCTAQSPMMWGAALRPDHLLFRGVPSVDFVRVLAFDHISLDLLGRCELATFDGPTIARDDDKAELFVVFDRCIGGLE